MSFKLKCAFVLVFLFLQTNIALANSNTSMTDEEIYLVQVKTNENGETSEWKHKRSPQRCPLRLFIEGNKLHFFGGDLPMTSSVRIYESAKETECASFCIDIASHEEVSLPETLAGGNYTIIVTVCNNIYKGFFELQ